MGICLGRDDVEDKKRRNSIKNITIYRKRSPKLNKE